MIDYGVGQLLEAQCRLETDLLKLLFLQLWTDFNLLLMNLILTELLVSLIGIPVDAAASAQGGWNMGATLCITVGFMLTTLGEFGKNDLYAIMLNHNRYLQYKRIKFEIIKLS